MEEIWKPVRGYEGLYEVSNLGRVKSLPRYVERGKGFLPVKGGIMGFSMIRGYRRVMLSRDARGRLTMVHRIVAEAFIENTNNKPFIDHINGIRDDNRVENLHWVTRVENMNMPLYRAKRKLIHARGKSKLAKKVEITKDGERKLFECCKDCAEYLGIAPQTLCNILHGRQKQPKGINIKFL